MSMPTLQRYGESRDWYAHYPSLGLGDGLRYQLDEIYQESRGHQDRVAFRDYGYTYHPDYHQDLINFLESLYFGVPDWYFEYYLSREDVDSDRYNQYQNSQSGPCSD